jgi:hypothetical protein
VFDKSIIPLLISLTDKNIYKVDAEITRAEFIKLNYLYLQK